MKNLIKKILQRLFYKESTEEEEKPSKEEIRALARSFESRVLETPKCETTKSPPKKEPREAILWKN